MKKALLLALTLTIATPNAHAADIKKLPIRCSNAPGTSPKLVAAYYA